MRIVLRPINEKDGDLIVKWRNTPKVLSHCLTKKPITVEENKVFYEQNVLTGKYRQFIVERIDEDFGLVTYPIATVYLKDIDEGNKRCELCIFTSNDAEWIEESQSIAIRLLLDKAFSDYGMHKVYSYVFYKYAEEVDLLKSAGFSVETILKEEALNEEGQYEDVVRLSIFNTK